METPQKIQHTRPYSVHGADKVGLVPPNRRIPKKFFPSVLNLRPEGNNDIAHPIVSSLLAGSEMREAMAQKTTLSTLLTKAYALIGGAAVQAQIYFRERIALLLERRCPKMPIRFHWGSSTHS
jgi:hypothetical protein